jgi:molybdenum cofactor cytidylyltransferase
VVGHRGDEIRRAVDPRGVVCVENPDYAEGMFTSVLAGVRALPKRCRAFFIHPADIPMVRWQTVHRLAVFCKDSAALVFYPTFDGRRGHPTLIRSCLAQQIQQWTGTGGLRAFLQGCRAESLEFPVADEAVLLDLDFPGDYSLMLGRLTNEGLPTEVECRVLTEGLPAAVIDHCRTVAAVTRKLAESLHGLGLDIDVELACRAALLHDIARTGKDHARAGARLLDSHGFTRLAPIVEAHMDLEVEPGRPLDEIQIVFLADKLVVGNQVADLEQRFARKMEKYGRDPEAAAAISRRRDTALCIRAKIEQKAGMTVEAILEAAGNKAGNI